jgi:hypothetical protein
MKELTCKMCGMNLGSMEQGKIRLGTILLCKNCWPKAESAVNIAELSISHAKNNPFTDLLGGFGKHK